MSCSQTIVSIDSRCDKGRGGVSVFYIANRADVTAITGLDSGQVTAITMASSAKFKTFNTNVRSSNVVSNGTYDEASGTRDVQTDANLVFGRMDGEKQAAIEALTKANVCIIYKDNNGYYWIMGEEAQGALCTASSADTGTEYTDRNGYTCTFTAHSDQHPVMVDPDVIADIIA